MSLCRYHGDWKSETQTVVSLLALLHWLETGNLLLHTDAQEQLGCMFMAFRSLFIHDFMSSYL